MYVILPAELQKKIAKKPETGMGYHLVTLITVDGKIEKVTILNNSIAKIPDEINISSEEIIDVE